MRESAGSHLRGPIMSDEWDALSDSTSNPASPSVFTYESVLAAMRQATKEHREYRLKRDVAFAELRLGGFMIWQMGEDWIVGDGLYEALRKKLAEDSGNLEQGFPRPYGFVGVWKLSEAIKQLRFEPTYETPAEVKERYRKEAESERDSP